ncbi:hypothetical protein NEIELOOT_01912 [Neisseria elongata subsp. glycolytica ATCC 29315]|uniref:Uncharacterized protein n=1 Tax=Neisseria elongata subsp. glycolytica ATCC 29315 TaxID=546263 RepID=D4DS69_NEIEG|nr:hypothetical protein NEIELOOT_01912 [Neisseria elongata subsp. glycolytica ATCC 29315]
MAGLHTGEGKCHRSLNGDTPFKVLQASFSTCSVKNATISYD